MQQRLESPKAASPGAARSRRDAEAVPPESGRPAARTSPDADERLRRARALGHRVDHLPRSTPAAQRVPLPKSDGSGLFRDHRSNSRDLRPLGGGAYLDLSTEPEVTVRHVAETDQYLLARNTFWDPVTADAYTSLGQGLYESMFGDLTTYRDGRYVSLAPLRDFLAGIWARRAALEHGVTKEALDVLYTGVYSGVDRPKPGHLTAMLKNIARWVLGMHGDPQDRYELLGKSTSDLSTALAILEEPGSHVEKDRNAAYFMLAKNYFFLYGREDVALNRRIIVNAAPADVLGVAQRVYDVVKDYPKAAGRMKFAGPITAQTKADSVLVYCDSGGEGYGEMQQRLVEGLAGRTAAGVPALSLALGTGIAIGDQPRDEAGLTFGQKRVGLAVIALEHSNESLDAFVRTAFVFFRTGGIDPAAPHREHGGPTDPRIIAKLGKLQKIWAKA